MNRRDEARQLRNRVDELRQTLDALIEQPPSGSNTRSARTVTVTTYPTSAGVAYGIQFTDITCTESEGSTPTISVQTGTEYAVNLGKTVPPVGTDILVEKEGGYWFFTYG